MTEVLAKPHWTELVYRENARLLFDVEAAIFQNNDLTRSELKMVERLAQMAADKDALLPLTAAPDPLYTLPPLAVKPSAFQFRSQFVDPADALAEAQQVGASTKAAWRERSPNWNLQTHLSKSPTWENLASGF